MTDLTKGQKAFLSKMTENGFVEHEVHFSRAQKNKCGWALVDKGLAVFEFGPRDSWLKTQGFMPPPAQAGGAS